MRVTVDKDALDRFIDEASAVWGQRDQEFCVGEAEVEASEQEFRDLVTALDVREP